jgi:hypothetical protein
MPYVLNGETLAYGQAFTVGDVQYSGVELGLWSRADLEALGLTWVEPEPVMPTVEQLCAAIDAERDRRMALDFTHDFGATPAVDDLGNEIEAGQRQLQMRPEDRANWQTLQGAALTAVVSSQPNAILPMRAEDNWNIQTTAVQVLGVLAEMTQHGSELLFAGGALKSQQRAVYPEVVDITQGWPS